VLSLKISTLPKGKTYSYNNKDEVYLNLVMNYMPETLYSLIKKYNKRKEIMPP
jgi:hypothetical protein